MAVQIKLTRTVTGHQGPISVIELREPRFGDFCEIGPIQRRIAHDPRQSGGVMRVEVVDEGSALMRWAQRLTGLPEGVLAQLATRDAHAVKSEIMRLVAELDEGNFSAPPTSSSLSSA